MTSAPPTDATMRSVLTEVKSIALIGATDREDRPANHVMAFLLSKGYRVHPVNPLLAGKMLHGQTVYASLDDLPETVDMVDVFRNSAAAGEVADQAVAHGAKAVWMQLGVVNEEAATRARAAGVTVIMDRCPAIEYPRLIGR
jgi:uncharacterized protein